MELQEKRKIRWKRDKSDRGLFVVNFNLTFIPASDKDHIGMADLADYLSL